MTIPKPASQLDCVWVEDCIEICRSRSVFVEERGIRATFRNPKGRRIRKIHYDGGYVASTRGRRADYIVGLWERIDVLVELKGSDGNLTGPSGAYEQIESTLELWKVDEHRYPRVAALIVFGRITVKKSFPDECQAHPRRSWLWRQDSLRSTRYSFSFTRTVKSNSVSMTF